MRIDKAARTGTGVQARRCSAFTPLSASGFLAEVARHSLPRRMVQRDQRLTPAAPVLVYIPPDPVVLAPVGLLGHPPAVKLH